MSTLDITATYSTDLGGGLTVGVDGTCNVVLSVNGESVVVTNVAALTAALDDARILGLIENERQHRDYLNAQTSAGVNPDQINTRPHAIA